jgi:hypothetical protein
MPSKKRWSLQHQAFADLSGTPGTNFERKRAKLGKADACPSDRCSEWEEIRRLFKERVVLSRDSGPAWGVSFSIM